MSRLKRSLRSRRLVIQSLESRIAMAVDLGFCHPLSAPAPLVVAPSAAAPPPLAGDVPPPADGSVEAVYGPVNSVLDEAFLGPRRDMESGTNAWAGEIAWAANSDTDTTGPVDTANPVDTADLVETGEPAWPAAFDVAVSSLVAAEGEAALATPTPIGSSPFDPNSDGEVTALDGLLVLTHLSRVQFGQEQTDAAAIRRFDVNGDGGITPTDALRILNEISAANQAGYSRLTIPLVTLDRAPTTVGGQLTAEGLGMRLSVATGVTKVYAALRVSGGAEQVSDLSSLLTGSTVQVSHDEVVRRFSPAEKLPLQWSFWTDVPGRAVRSRAELVWSLPPEPPPPADGILWAGNAEVGSGAVIDQTHSSYSLIKTDVSSQGSRAFHLVHPTGAHEGFVADQTIRARTDTKLFFMSRLGYAMKNQVAKVYVSTDGGATWAHEVFSQPGTEGAGETSFSLREVDLSAFARRDIRVRFLYERQAGLIYTQTETRMGWWIDDIQIGSAFRKSQFSIGNPSNQEQHLLEYIYRARVDALTEANRLAAETDPAIKNAYTVFGVTAANIRNQYSVQAASGFLARNAQPLSFQTTLLRSSEMHSQDMLSSRIQAHTSSSNPPAPFKPGFTPSQRAQSLGYVGNVAESVYAHAQSVRHVHASFTVDWGGDSPSQAEYNPAFRGQGMQNPAGHRKMVHGAKYNEIGVGIVAGSSGNVGPLLVTADFGSTGTTYVTGVAYRDTNRNGFYDPGEGLGGVRVDVPGSAYYAITSASGGYSVPVNGNKTYSVAFSGGGQPNWSTNVLVSASLNKKVDYRLT